MKGVSKSTAEKLKAFDYQVYHALDRSAIRLYVLLYLLKYPEKAAISDIADSIDVSYTNIWGAVVGGNRKYKKEDSMLSLGLITREKARHNVYLYSLTPKGYVVAKMLEEADLDRDIQPDEEVRSESCC